MKYRIKSRLVVPVMPIAPGAAVAVTVLQPIRDSAPGKDGKVVQLMRVTPFDGVVDDSDGTVSYPEYDIVVATVLRDIILEHFKDDAYVGRSFLIEKSASARKTNNGQYYTYNLSEIEKE